MKFRYFLMLSLTFVVFEEAVHAQENETGVSFEASTNEVSETTTTTANREIRIVFLHESNQRDFSAAVDKIIEELKRTGIEINYQNLMFTGEPSDSLNLNHQICGLGEKGISIVIDGTLSGISKMIRDTLRKRKVPYYNFDYSIQSFVKMMESYLLERKAMDAVFIFQNERETDEALFNFIMNSSLRVILLDQLTSNVIERLKTLRPMPNYYAIIANTVNMKVLFKRALVGGLLNRLPDRWNLMFTDFDAGSFKYDEYPEMSRLLLNETVCCNPTCICTSHETLKFEALSSFLQSMVGVFEANDFPIVKFSCSADVQKQNTEKLLNDLSAMIETNNLIYVDADLKIWQNLKFDVKTSIVVDNKGVKMIANHQIKKTQRFLRVGVTESIPYTYYKRDPKSNKILRDELNQPLYEGFCIDFINALSQKMDFSFELVEPSSGKFGERARDGSFDGLIGDLINGETDLIVAALKMTADREEQIDFVAPYFDQTGILITMKKPIPDTSLFKFMTVLRLEVWLSILGALAITAVVIWILEVFSPYSARNWSYNEQCREFTLRESFWFALTSFTPQGGGEAPKALSGRVIVAAYWLFVVLMLATFTANLAAFLTVERMQSPVQSLDQLSRQSRINYTVVRNSDTHQYFKNMKHAEDKLYELWKSTTLSSTSDEAQYRIWDYPVKEQYASILMSIESAKPLPNASEGFRIVNEQETNDFAFIHDAQEIKYEISRNCNFSAVGEVFAEQPYAVAVQQGSHLQDEVSRVILELQKERFFEELTAKYWNSTQKGSCIVNDDSEGITLESLGGVFIATLVGLVIAMLVLIGEVYYYNRKTKKEKKANNSELFNKKIQPFENFEHKEKILKNSILLGPGTFKPTNEKNSRLSIISVYPRD